MEAMPRLTKEPSKVSPQKGLISLAIFHNFKNHMIYIKNYFAGILYGYDRPYAVQKIWEPFTAANCEDLAGKPKLFFIQVF